MAKKKCYFPECYDNNIKWDDENLIKFNGKNYCKNHYPIVKKENDDRLTLINYIRSIFNVPYPSGLILGQIKKFHDVNGYTYEGIKEAIELIKVTPNLVLSNSKGIGIVPWYYDKAQELKNSRVEQTKGSDTKRKVYINRNNFEKNKKEELFDFSSEDDLI